MTTSNADSPTLETQTRKLRTFLTDVMAAAGDDTPAICKRIRQTRERLYQEWTAEHGTKRGNPFTQEKVARRIVSAEDPQGITVGAYGAFERFREPSLERLRQIAFAFNLDEDYFLPSSDLASATARVDAEAVRLAEVGDEFAELLKALRTLVEDPAPGPSPSELD